jgi:hypothetical protein
MKLLLFILTTATLGINNGADETLGITAELKITSQAANFIKQILSLLAYGGRSTVNILNQIFSISVSGLCMIYHNFIAYFPVISIPQGLGLRY